MLFRSLVVVGAVVSATVSAAPVAAPDFITPGNNVLKLRKRAGLTDENGVFDYDRFVAINVATKNKHRQNIINLANNLGEQTVTDLATIPSKVAARLAQRWKTKRQAEALTDEEDNEEWAGDITIGSDDQKFLIDFDTGSSDLWVPSSTCTSDICSEKNTYDASSSTSSVAEKGTFEIEYGDGSTVEGSIYEDAVHIAGINVTKQTFSAVTQLSSSFADDPIDGLLGMAFPAISNLRADPFLLTAKSEGSVANSTFGVKLATNGSALYLGGTDTSQYTGSIEFHAINTTTGFWQATGGSVSTSGKAVITDINTIIDTGTTLMYGPPTAVADFYKEIDGVEEYPDEAGLYVFPCDSNVTATLSWGGKDWAISATDFNIGQVEEGSTDCVAALMGEDLGLGTNTWLLGDTFIRNVYAVFDYSDSKVGFATLA
ncbi:acid protease [Fistulina hepatica ATCC 64428]|uniref:Acid protease n=1 Tax=Fistulina hepatica ATCC 64428 TaxID=1128425 RepID=A0A0D7A311_9AGAR|nr:acid protease [Fistulina hepatica ATCC 64428]